MDESKEDRPRAVKITRIVERSPTVKSLHFHDETLEMALPGQFAMVWVPGLDEIPMSVTKDPIEGSAEIVVKVVGEATEELHRLHPGDLIGVRGPYGTWFKVNDRDSLLVVAGGTGVTPLRRVISEESSKRSVTLVLGAKTRKELILLEEFEGYGVDVLPATDDGTVGFAGSAVKLAKKLIRKGGISSILCCGPELMILELVKFAFSYNISLQASLERIMKCGVGVCGSCAIAGYRVCKDGPVFELSKLLDMSEELGKVYRDYSGRIVPLNT